MAGITWSWNTNELSDSQVLYATAAEWAAQPGVYPHASPVDTRLVSGHSVTWPRLRWRSTDTMKGSKDSCNNRWTVGQIALGVTNAAQLGTGTNVVTHVAISTPWDYSGPGDSTAGYLRQWVAAVRNVGVNVWYRSHPINWEGDYGAPGTLTPAQYLTTLDTFIRGNPDLFVSGDILDPCPEPENGHYWNANFQTSSFNDWQFLVNPLAQSGRDAYNAHIVNVRNTANAALIALGITGVNTNIISTNGYVAWGDGAAGDGPPRLYTSTIAGRGLIVIDSYPAGMQAGTADQRGQSQVDEVNMVVARLDRDPSTTGLGVVLGEWGILPGANEQQSLTDTGASLGSFTLTYSASTTVGIAYNANASAVTTALNNLGTINADGNVNCFGGPLPGTPVTIQWNNPGARSLITTSGATGLTGGSAVVTRATAGSSLGDDAQLRIIKSTIDQIARHQRVIGSNYWVSISDSGQDTTRLISGGRSGTMIRPAAPILAGLYADMPVPLTTYHYVVRSVDALGNQTLSSDATIAYAPGATNVTPAATQAVSLTQSATIAVANATTQAVRMTETASVVPTLAVFTPIIVPTQIPGMGPALVIEVAFTTNPSDPPVWTDITRYVQGTLTINRGRQRELDQIQAGTLALELDNRDRRFDPTYTGSPYYPYILPMRRIRARATYNNSTYPLFTGYVESWGQTWAGWQDASVPVTAADAFKPLNLAQLNTSFPAETSNQRINEVLSAIAWTIGGAAWTVSASALGTTTVVGPTGDRVISPGSSTIQASTLANTPALQHMQDVTTTEMGLLFTDRDGAVTFKGRGGIVNTLSLGTFGESTGELPYASVEMLYDDTNVWNDVEITRIGGIQQSAKDPASQSQYYTRTLSNTSVLNNSDVEALSLATALLGKYAQPSLQISAMTLDGWGAPASIFPQMLGREIGERVTVRRRPPGGGPVLEQASIIQGIAITHTVAGGDWSVTWRLTPADVLNYWTLNDPTLSVLGSTTRVFF